MNKEKEFNFMESSKIKHLLFTVLLIAIIVFTSCKNKSNNNLAIEIPKDEAVEIKIHRYEKVLMNIDANNIRNELKKFKSEYALFLDGNLDDTLKVLQLYNYISDPTLHEIYDDIILKYPDIKYLEKDLSEAFTYFKHYFPLKPTPKIYSYISFLDYENRVLYLDTVMAIALDMYLGADYKMYPSVKIPRYISNRLDSNYITTDCMKSIAISMIDFSPENKTLLDNMIYLGKILYFSDAMLPKLNEEIKIGYSKTQLDWCKSNESNIWAFFLKNNLLYNSDYYKIRPFITEAPTTKGFKDASPRFGEWMGWQIVKSYMNENKKATIEDLFKENDSQKILQISKYKPQK